MLAVDGKPNLFLPHLVRIAAARDETPDVRTIRLEFLEPDAGRQLQWDAGQFGEFSVFGAGESVFTLANAPTRPGYIECTYRAIGKVSGAIRSLSVGQVLGFRGPYGNRFPVEQWRGRDLLFVGGGIGMAALRSPLQFVLDNRQDFGEIVVLNGARSVADMVYKEEMTEWQQTDGVRVVRAVDPGGETPDWDGEVGLIPNVFEQLGLKADSRVVVVCGPPVMLRYMFLSLERTGYAPEQVVTTLENKMKCGLGLCGRCNIGRIFVCRDGPVFTWAQMQTLPKDF
ncbi:MAG: FAD/NAD(P)-binding protein [Candidatus Rokubacteria bacterium]|nr:FAD/NAD(P)-binding protein [Candidatus Rokubacteria bacterium]